MTVAACSPEAAPPNAWSTRTLTMAFQPVVNTDTGRIIAYEALFRGPEGESVAEYATGLTPEMLPTFDLRCRIAAIEQALEAGIIERQARLAVKVMPTFIEDPEADAERMLRIVRRLGFPHRQLVLEFSERDDLESAKMTALVQAYQKRGFRAAFDDFGAADNGLALLSHFTPDTIKLAPELVHRLCSSWSRRLVVEKVAQVANAGGMLLIAEGVETRGEFDRLRALGVPIMQGDLIAGAQVGRLPLPTPIHPGG
ncbi:EAL domain-containing protein [Sphingomonas sp. CJ20]